MMHPLVRDLLKRVCLLKREHYDPGYLMNMARKEFQKNADLSDELAIRKAVAYGRWMVREEQGRNRFYMYREMKKRYDPEFQFHRRESPQHQPTATRYNESSELHKLERGIDE